MPASSDLHQPTRRDPLVSYWAERVDTLGVIGLRCRFVMHLERPPLAPAPFLFAADSGASYSIISLELAQSRQIPVPPPETEITLPARSAFGLSPMRVRPGRFRAWWHGDRRGYPFDWPVLFQVNAPLGTPSILGLGGVINTCRWTFDGGFSHSSPYGQMILEDIR